MCNLYSDSVQYLTTLIGWFPYIYYANDSYLIFLCSISRSIKIAPLINKQMFQWFCEKCLRNASEWLFGGCITEGQRLCWCGRETLQILMAKHSKDLAQMKFHHTLCQCLRVIQRFRVLLTWTILILAWNKPSYLQPPRPAKKEKMKKSYHPLTACHSMTSSF